VNAHELESLRLAFVDGVIRVLAPVSF